MASEDIVINVDVTGAEKLHQLSTGVTQVYKALYASNTVMRQTNAASRALSQAVGSTGRSMNDHAKSVTQLVRNQSALSREIAKVNRDLGQLRQNFTKLTADEQKAVGGLQKYANALKNVKARAFVSDLQSIAREQKRLGKDAQFVGRSLIIGLTTPLVAMGRYGLQSLVAVDKETVRLNKVLESVAPNAEAAAQKLGSMSDKTRINQMVKDFNELNNSLTAVSQKFGVAKSMTVSLAADFAELGITNQKNIARLTELTAATEKLGSMDLGASQDLVQSLYFQAVRSFDQSGKEFKNAMEREKAAIDAASAQLAMFNSIENTTALTLRDLGDAFPEVAAVATSFGLSMTETAAMLAPMKAAGFEVGAAANSIKVSLQRVTAPTKQNMDLFKSLGKEFGSTFGQIHGTGLEAIQALIDSFNQLKSSAKGQEGALEFMSKVFGVRQGPRMEVAIQQMASFDKLLKNASASGDLAEKRIQNIANTTITSFNQSNKTLVPLVNSFKDIGVLARIATAQAGQMVEGFGKVNERDIATAREARKSIGDEILKANKEGRDLIAEISTEAGRAMVVELAGAKNAQDIANRELDASLKSLDTQLSILKNNFKLFAADLVQQLKPAFEKIAKISSNLYNAWQKLSPETKQLASKITLLVAAVTASVGPLVFIFGQMRLAVGVLGGALFSFLPALKTMDVTALAASSAMTRLTNPITLVGDTIQNTNGKFATWIATLASGEGPVGTFAKKIGLLTGVLQKGTTADASVMAALTATKGAEKVADDAMLGAIGAKQGMSAPARQVSALAKKSGQRLRVGGKFASAETVVADVEQLRAKMAQGPLRGPTGRFIGLSATQKANMALVQQAESIASKQTAISNIQSTRGLFLKRGRGLGMTDTGDFTLKGRAISETRGQAIASGGLASMRARIAEVPGAMREKLSGAKQSMTGLSTKPLTAFRTAVANAKSSVKSLESGLSELGAKQPGIFKKAITAVRGFAGSFKSVTSAMNLMKMAWVATGIGAAILAVAAVVYIVVKNFDKFKTIAKPGIDAIKDAIKILKDALFALIKPFINLFATIGGGGKDSSNSVKPIAQAFNVLGESIKIIAKVIAFVFRQIGKVIQYLLGGVLSAFRGVINLVQGIIKIFKGDFKEGFSQAFKGLIQGVYGLLGPFRKVFDFIIGLLVKFAKVAAAAIGWIPGLGDAAKKAAKGLESFQKMLKDSSTIKNAMDKGGKEGATSIKTSIKSASNDIQETISNAVGDGLGDGAETGAQKLAKKIKDVKREVKKAGLDAAAGFIQDAITSIKDNFAAEKEKALEVFNTQLEAIDKLKQADESLTKTKEYESNKRAIIEERELNRENYVRNRALAIYEGRIDDARMLGLEEKKSILDSTRQKEQLEESRRRDLAEENFAFLKKTIEDAKQQAGKFFDDAVTNFEKAAKEIAKFPPANIEEFRKQISGLTTAANGEATKINDQFTTLFDDVKTKIETQMPNKVVGVFANKLSDVVTEARTKYGLDDPTTGVVGATVGLIGAISAKFGSDTSIKDNFSTGITGAIGTTFDTWATTMKDLTVPNLMQGIKDAMKPFTDPTGEKSWAAAMKAGLAAVTSEYSLAVAGMEADTVKLTNKLIALIKKFNTLSEQGSDAAGGAGGGGAGVAGNTNTGLPGSGEASSANFRLMDEQLSKPVNTRSTVQLYGTDQFIAQIGTLKDVITGKNYHQLKNGMYSIGFSMPNGDQATYSYTPKALIESAWMFAKVEQAKTASQFKDLIGGSKAYDAYIKKMNIKPNLKRYGGYVKAAASQSIPALLHGGEFVISAGAVNKMSRGALESINNMRFTNPSTVKPTVVSENNSTQNVNIYVDNFIGQDQWFESMMKEYNIKVVPKNQKVAGLEQRVIRTYNGINRGM